MDLIHLTRFGISITHIHMERQLIAVLHDI